MPRSIIDNFHYTKPVDDEGAYAPVALVIAWDSDTKQLYAGLSADEALGVVPEADAAPPVSNGK